MHVYPFEWDNGLLEKEQLGTPESKLETDRRGWNNCAAEKINFKKQPREWQLILVAPPNRATTTTTTTNNKTVAVKPLEESDDDDDTDFALN